MRWYSRPTVFKRRDIIIIYMLCEVRHCTCNISYIYAPDLNIEPECVPAALINGNRCSCKTSRKGGGSGAGIIGEVAGFGECYKCWA